MYISSFSSHTQHWNIDNLQLGSQNLIVGKNAGGKSNTLKELWYFLRDLLEGNLKSEGKWNIVFTVTETTHITFDISKEKNIVQLRNMKLNEQLFKIEYKNDYLQIWDAFGSKHETLQIEWRSFLRNIKTFLFANTEANTGAIRLLDKTLKMSDFSIHLSKTHLQKVAEYMNQIGYSIEKNYYEATTQKVFITEKGTDGLLPIEKMSQGMFRAFSLLMYLTYLIDIKEVSLFIIDDFCEGLDYERATKLGALVFNICKENNIQLIATTNDSFLMDTIDISCWNLLQRNGENITTINDRSKPELFEKFKLSGLSNFDFFASDYISRQLQKQEI